MGDEKDRVPSMNAPVNFFMPDIRLTFWRLGEMHWDEASA